MNLPREIQDPKVGWLVPQKQRPKVRRPEANVHDPREEEGYAEEEEPVSSSPSPARAVEVLLMRREEKIGDENEQEKVFLNTR